MWPTPKSIHHWPFSPSLITSIHPDSVRATLFNAITNCERLKNQRNMFSAWSTLIKWYFIPFHAVYHLLGVLKTSYTTNKIVTSIAFTSLYASAQRPIHKCQWHTGKNKISIFDQQNIGHIIYVFSQSGLYRLSTNVLCAFGKCGCLTYIAWGVIKRVMFMLKQFPNWQQGHTFHLL